MYKLSCCSACSVPYPPTLMEKWSILQQKSKNLQETHIARIQVGWTWIRRSLQRGIRPATILPQLCIASSGRHKRQFLFILVTSDNTILVASVSHIRMKLPHIYTTQCGLHSFRSLLHQVCKPHVSFIPWSLDQRLSSHATPDSIWNSALVFSCSAFLLFAARNTSIFPRWEGKMLLLLFFFFLQEGKIFKELLPKLPNSLPTDNALLQTAVTQAIRGP